MWYIHRVVYWFTTTPSKQRGVLNWFTLDKKQFKRSKTKSIAISMAQMPNKKQT